MVAGLGPWRLSAPGKRVRRAQCEFRHASRVSSVYQQGDILVNTQASLLGHSMAPASTLATIAVVVFSVADLERMKTLRSVATGGLVLTCLVTLASSCSSRSAFSRTASSPALRSRWCRHASAA